MRLNKLESILTAIIIVLAYTNIHQSYNKDIVSTKPIEPYKVVLTKVDGKVIKTYYYKQK